MIVPLLALAADAGFAFISQSGLIRHGF